MSDSAPLIKPKREEPEFDIHYGADVNDIEEIEGAINEDPSSLNEPEKLTGKTALAITAADGNFLALHFLLEEHRADPWIADKKQRLPLDYARAIGHQACRELLLQHMYPDLDSDTGSPDVVPLFPVR